jgi:hypothetical protein
MSDYAKGVKKVPFDGTKESLYLWTTLLMGFAETYGRDQALLGTLTVPPFQLTTLDPYDPLDKILLAARKANSTAMCLLRRSLTYQISQIALYSSKTTELPGGTA